MSSVNVLIADPHENPDRLSAEFKAAILRARASGNPLVVLGDFAHILPYGYEAYLGSPMVQEFVTILEDDLIILIGGNHDPEYLLRRLFADYPNVQIFSDFTIGNVYLCHGHRWGPLWSWLSWFADDIVRAAVAVCPGTWLKFAGWAGWTPSQVKSEERYHAVVLSLLIKAIQYRSKHGRLVAMGHSHKKYSLREDGDIVVASLPPLVSGVCAETDGASLSFKAL